MYTFILNNYLVVDFHKRDTDQKFSVCSLWDYNINKYICIFTKKCNCLSFYHFVQEVNEICYQRSYTCTCK